MIVQKVLVIVAVLSVPVLLLGKPIQEYISHKRKRSPLSVSNPSEFIYFSVWEWTRIQFFCLCVCVTMLSSSVGRQTSFASRKRLYKCSPGRGGCKRRRRGGKREIGEVDRWSVCNELVLFNDSFRVIWLLNAWEMSVRALDGNECTLIVILSVWWESGLWSEFVCQKHYYTHLSEFLNRCAQLLVTWQIVTLFLIICRVFDIVNTVEWRQFRKRLFQ